MSTANPDRVGCACGGVVLAAGAARRLGGRPKALLERDGTPLVRRTAAVLLDAGVRDVVVVSGCGADAVAAAVQGLGVRVVRHEGWAAGQVSSLRAGLAALPAAVDAVLVALADQPLLEVTDVNALLEAYARRGDARAIVPRVAGRRGNPVVFDALVREAILQGGDDYGARQWMREHPAQVAWLDCERPAYVEDVDEPRDLARIAQKYGCVLGWPGD